jgi:WD40 repeat protein
MEILHQTASTGSGYELIKTLAFTPDGRRLVTGDKTGCACTWDTETGQLVFGPL